jgi:hypothetical protein
LFAFRTAYPRELIDKKHETLVGRRNDEATRLALSGEDTIVLAWGRLNAAIAAHYEKRLDFLKQVLGDRSVYAVGKPVAGMFPRHGRTWNRENRTLMKYEFRQRLWKYLK